MLPKIKRLIIVVLSVCVLAVSGLNMSANIALAGSGSINQFDLSSENVLQGTTIQVKYGATCPGGAFDSTKFYVDGSQYVYELGGGSINFDLQTGSINPGQHNLVAYLSCNGENKQNPTTATKGFYVQSKQQSPTVTPVPVSNQNPVNQPVNPPAVNPPVNPGPGGNGLTVTQARQQTYGGVDLNVWCGATNQPTARNTNGLWNGWLCGNNPVDWTRVCSDVWGTSNYSHGDGQYTIVCGGTQQPVVNPPVNPPSSGGKDGCSIAGVVLVGDYAQVTPGKPNNLRDGPGTNNNKIGSIPGGGQFKVVGGPSCDGTYRWWQVNYNGTIGWTAEGDGSTYWIQAINQPAQQVQSPSPQVQAIINDINSHQGKVAEPSAQLTKETIAYLLKNGTYLSSSQAAEVADQVVEVVSTCGVSAAQIIGNVSEGLKGGPYGIGAVASIVSNAVQLSAINDSATSDCILNQGLAPKVQNIIDNNQ